MSGFNWLFRLIFVFCCLHSSISEAQQTYQEQSVAVVQDKKKKIEIRQLSERDIVPCAEVFTGENEHWIYNERVLRECFEDQERKLLVGWIAYVDDEPAGLVMLRFSTPYIHFTQQGIPEICDMFVLPKFRELGIATQLMSAAEKEAEKLGYKQVGLSVGLHFRFGAAHRMYSKRGFMPDGRGITHDHMHVPPGAVIPIGEHTCLWLVKDLRSNLLE